MVYVLASDHTALQQSLASNKTGQNPVFKVLGNTNMDNIKKPLSIKNRSFMPQHL